MEQDREWGNKPWISNYFFELKSAFTQTPPDNSPLLWSPNPPVFFVQSLCYLHLITLLFTSNLLWLISGPPISNIWSILCHYAGGDYHISFVWGVVYPEEFSLYVSYSLPALWYDCWKFKSRPDWRICQVYWTLKGLFPTSGLLTLLISICSVNGNLSMRILVIQYVVEWSQTLTDRLLWVARGFIGGSRRGLEWGGESSSLET